LAGWVADLREKPTFLGEIPVFIEKLGTSRQMARCLHNSELFGGGFRSQGLVLRFDGTTRRLSGEFRGFFGAEGRFFLNQLQGGSVQAF
jgi:hypothetical protein